MELTFEVSPFVKFDECDGLLTETSGMECKDVKANLKGGELEKMVVDSGNIWNQQQV